jgi:hypothetical protein
LIITWPGGECPAKLTQLRLATAAYSKLTCCVDPIILPSARKHGVSDEDILHAYANPIRIFDLDDDFTMVIGANRAAVIYEIGVVGGVATPVIIHAMKARSKYLR